MPTIEESQKRIENRKRQQEKIRQRKQRFELKGVKATLAQATRERLIAAALHTFGCSVEDPAIVTAWVEDRINGYLSKQPYWFGRTESADAQHRSNQRAYAIKHGRIEAQAQPEHLRRKTIDQLIAEDEAAQQTANEQEAQV